MEDFARSRLTRSKPSVVAVRRRRRSTRERCWLVVGLRARVPVDEFAFQGVIHEQRELAGGGGDGLRFADPAGESAIERAERRRPAAEGHRGHAQDRGGPIGRRLGA